MIFPPREIHALCADRSTQAPSGDEQGTPSAAFTAGLLVDGVLLGVLFLVLLGDGVLLGDDGGSLVLGAVVVGTELVG